MTMQSHVQVAVIGGGVAGCSVLYHLTKLGWRDVVLLERDELTSGSTWHAAGGLHGLHDNNNVSRMQYYTLQLYRELERETGMSLGIHQPGTLYLAGTRQREHQLRIQASRAPAYGAEFYEVSGSELLDLNPLLNTEGVRLAMYEPLGGYLDPSAVTQAYARAARTRGATIHRHTPVIETRVREDGSWNVVTLGGTLHAEVVVNAAGLWGREVARMAGFRLPLIPIEHQYFVTEDIPRISGLDRELASVAERDKEYYLRQEGNGLLVGAYEKAGKVWAEAGTPEDFGHDLFDPDLDRISDIVMGACSRVPALAEAGIKRVINGPMIWSPDASALIGPVRGLKNYFVCNGIIPGFSQSAGLGKTVAEWIVEGEPESDMFVWDVARFGSWTTRSYARAAALDAYGSRFRIHFPNQEIMAGRPLKTRPAYELQKSLGAVFGLSYGWEHPHWFASAGTVQEDEFSFERPRWFEMMGQEALGLRQSAGLIDVSNFAKYRISGPNAVSWLDRIIANHVPGENGRMCLTPLLGLRAGVSGDMTVGRVSDRQLFMIGSGMAEDYHLRIFDEFLPARGVTFECVTEQLCGVNVAGPQARRVIERLTDRDLSSEALPFMHVAQVRINGHDAMIMRVSFSGDLGFEIYVDAAYHLELYRTALEAGAEFGIRPVGSRALASLRIEKGYGSWGREYSPEWRPDESGVERLVKIAKPSFAGRDAWMQIREQPPRQLLCQFSIETRPGKTGSDAWGGESIFRDGQYVGRITSGSYSFTAGKSVALGYVDTGHAVPGDGFEVAIVGVSQPARLLDRPLFDPAGERLRA